MTKVNQFSSTVPRLSYRAEIDGLRAVAVVSVIFYHAQIIFFGHDWFEGGFIGVDIFFVISGYLITRIILLELEEKGSFNILKFYERRARRILPMLFLVIFVSFPFAWQILLPAEFIEYAESILASVFFGSNFFFYFSTTEYGSDSAFLKPFLHTWSLSVEEQFYLVFPFLSVASYKYFRSYFLTILIVLSLISLLFAQVMEARNPDLNFYLPFSRFWEISVGSLLAVRELNHTGERGGFWSKFLPLAGLFLIVCSVVFFNSKTPHPGLYTIIPILGVALIIAFASQDDWAGKLLGTKPFTWVGLISYSAYLWHFPIFAFVRVANINLTNGYKLLLIALAIILSIISYHYVEKPLRNFKIISFKKLLIILGVSTFAILGASIATIRSDGFTQRFSQYTVSSKQMTYYRRQYWDDYSPFLNGKRGTLIDFVNESGSRNNILVIGNSWAHDIAVGLSKLNDTTVQFEEMTGHKCNEFILPLFGADHKDYQQWAERCSQNASRFNKIPNNTDTIVLSDNLFISGQYNNEAVKKAFEENINAIRRDFNGKILIIKGRPTWEEGGFRMMLDVPDFSDDSNQLVQKYLIHDVRTMLEADAYYEAFYAKYDVDYLSLVKAFCDEKTCRLFGEQQVLYFDTQHLTSSGADNISLYLKSRIR